MRPTPRVIRSPPVSGGRRVPPAGHPHSGSGRSETPSPPRPPSPRASGSGERRARQTRAAPCTTASSPGTGAAKNPWISIPFHLNPSRMRSVSSHSRIDCDLTAPCCTSIQKTSRSRVPAPPRPTRDRRSNGRIEEVREQRDAPDQLGGAGAGVASAGVDRAGDHERRARYDVEGLGQDEPPSNQMPAIATTHSPTTPAGSTRLRSEAPPRTGMRGAGRRRRLADRSAGVVVPFGSFRFRRRSRSDSSRGSSSRTAPSDRIRPSARVRRPARSGCADAGGGVGSWSHDTESAP